MFWVKFTAVLVIFAILGAMFVCVGEKSDAHTLQGGVAGAAFAVALAIRNRTPGLLYAVVVWVVLGVAWWGIFSFFQDFEKLGYAIAISLGFGIAIETKYQRSPK